MKRTLISSLLVANLIVTPIFAQKQPEQAKLAEVVEVRVINIDVVVTDRKGNPIKGLTAADFDVYENGKLQKITNFSEINAAAIPAAPKTAEQPAAPPREVIPEEQRRMVVFFIDNLSMAPFNRNRVFKEMKTFAKDVLRPGDQAMIATWNRSFKVRVPFTGDAVHIQQTLDSIAGESALGLQALSDRRSVEGQIRESRSFQDAVVMARQYAQSVEHDVRQSVSALDSLMTTLAGVEGKKILLITTEGFQIQPGREMFQFLEEMKKQKGDWMHASSSLMEGMSFNTSSLIERIARTANANGITLYTLHAGGLLGMNEGSAENAAPVPHSVSMAALSSSTDSLNLMAEMTGGRAVVGTNNFKDAFARIQRDHESYYSVGYRSTAERIDRQRSIEVKPKNRSYVVRSRRSFVEKSITSEMNDRVIANLFYPTGANELKITVVTGRPIQVESDRFRVPIEVHVPMTALTFLPQGEVYQGGFSVYVGVANKFGDLSDVNRESQRLNLTADDLTKIQGKHYAYTADLIMEKGRNKISVGVVDEISNVTGFDVREILAADLN